MAEPRIRKKFFAPEPVDAQVVAIRGGDVYIFPASKQTITGRRIIGATVSVKSIAAAQDALERGGIDFSKLTQNEKSKSIFLPPFLTHGVWLELREVN